jgi:predicted double-glycine peptidase
MFFPTMKTVEKATNRLKKQQNAIIKLNEEQSGQSVSDYVDQVAAKNKSAPEVTMEELDMKKEFE